MTLKGFYRIKLILVLKNGKLQKQIQQQKELIPKLNLLDIHFLHGQCIYSGLLKQMQITGERLMSIID